MDYLISDNEAIYNSSLTLAPSGTFLDIQKPDVYDSYKEAFTFTEDGVNNEYVELFNPGFLPQDGFDEAVEPLDIGSFMDVSAEKCERIITYDKIASYTDKIIAIASETARLKPDIMICPLRGGLKANIMVHNITERNFHLEYLPFTQNSNPKFREPIIKGLFNIIEKHHKHLFKILVIDTSIGGQGINNLIDF